MLAGYLPFDDDPANPDGDNINLLYKYIVTTPLTFPEYVTPHARDLLRRILVPDPRKRADLFEVARHSWLSEFSHIVSHITSSTTQVAEIANTTIPQGMQSLLLFFNAHFADNRFRRTKRTIAGAQRVGQRTSEILSQSRFYRGRTHPPLWGHLARSAVRQVQDLAGCQAENGPGRIRCPSVSDRPRGDSYCTKFHRFEHDPNRGYSHCGWSRGAPRGGARRAERRGWRIERIGSWGQHSGYGATPASNATIRAADYRWFDDLVQRWPPAVARFLWSTCGSYGCGNQCSGSSRTTYKQAICDLRTYPSRSNARRYHVHRAAQCSGISIQIQYHPSPRGTKGPQTVEHDLGDWRKTFWSIWVYFRWSRYAAGWCSPKE